MPPVMSWPRKSRKITNKSSRSSKPGRRESDGRDHFMKVSEIIGSLSLLALGIFMTWQATKLSLGTPRAPGPGFFPFYAALLLIGISLTIFLQALQKKQGEREGGRRWERVVLTLALIFVYA